MMKKLISIFCLMSTISLCDPGTARLQRVLGHVQVVKPALHSTTQLTGQSDIFFARPALTKLVSTTFGTGVIRHQRIPAAFKQREDLHEKTHYAAYHAQRQDYR